MRTRTIVVGALIFALLFAPAKGDHETVKDANDTRGRADIRSLRMENDRPRKWIFKTWRAWRVNDFFERGYFIVHFDTIGGRHFEYYVFVHAMRRRLGAALWRNRRNGDDRRVASVKVRKAGRKLVKVFVPFRKMKIGRHRLEYRWFGRSIWSGNSCRRLCLDRAPNRGAISELLVPNP